MTSKRHFRMYLMYPHTNLQAFLYVSSINAVDAISVYIARHIIYFIPRYPL